MVSPTFRSRAHYLTRTYGVVLALLCLFVDVGKHEEIIQPNGLRICSKDEPTLCTDNASFSHLNKFCRTNSISTLNLTGVNISHIKEMRLDFCSSTLPSVFLLDDMGADFVDTRNCTISTDKMRRLECKSLYDVQALDKELQLFHTAYVDILQRHEFNLVGNYDVKKCEKAYKDWLCSSTKLQHKLNGEPVHGCRDTANCVCYACPSFEPDNTYGGFSAFQCEDGECVSDEQPSSGCAPTCISNRTLNVFVGNVTGTT